MVYEIMPPKWELFLAKLVGMLSEKEERVYDDLRTLEAVLGDHATPGELLDCRTRRLPEIYRVYALIEGNDRKPYLHKWYHEILARFDERIGNLE